MKLRKEEKRRRKEDRRETKQGFKSGAEEEKKGKRGRGTTTIHIRNHYDTNLDETGVLINQHEHVPVVLRELVDVVCEVQNTCIKMGHWEMSKEELVNTLRKMKKGEAACPDNLKPEFFKALNGSKEGIKALQNSLNKIQGSGSVPESWKESKTIMIPKTKNPRCLYWRSTNLNLTRKLLQITINSPTSFLAN